MICIPGVDFVGQKLSYPKFIMKYPYYNALSEMGWQCAVNPAYARGLHFTGHTRILCFKEPVNAACYIDFVRYPIQPGMLYIIPSLHAHYFNEKECSDFICIDVCNERLLPEHRRFLHSVRYTREKVLRPPTQEKTYDLLYQLAFTSKIDLSLDRMANFVTGKLTAGATSHRLHKLNQLNSLSDRIMSVLKMYDFRADNCRVDLFASAMCLSERNLHRLCSSIFGVSARHILDYYLMLHAVKGLIHAETVSCASKKLGFSSVHAFSRYIKRLTGYTPTALLKRLQADGL